MPAQPLPVQPTPFIGRTNELGRLAELLADPNCRLVSIIGPGGIGKTRLVLQVAADQAPHFPHGVYFVPLQGVNTTDLIPSVIASALKITLYGAEEARVQIINFLREKRLLLVMDNFEHLLNGTELISEVLAAATSVKILATSRERLNMQEEWMLTLQGLAFPDEQPTEAPESYSAVQLFIQRARQVQAEFVFNPNAEAVKQICQQVEGMPLGIELAATWLRVMTCQQIAVQMARSLDFLTSPLRNVPERHRSLRAVFEQSWSLLSAGEQDVLMRLAVFRGGFDLEAAEDIASATLIVLADLVDKSLIRVNATGRYDIHELIRQYAQDKLAEAGETISTAQRHLAYFVKLAEDGETHAYGREQIVWYDRQEAEMDNLRAALAWSLSSEDIEMGLRMASALRWVWEMRGHVEEGVSWMEKLLPFRDGITLSVRIKALHRASDLAGHLCAPWRSDNWGEEALRLARATNDKWNIAWALSALGFEIEEMHLDQAAELFVESVALFRELDDPFGLSHSLRRLAYCAMYQGDYPYAQTLIEEVLTRDREAGDKNAMAWELMLLGNVVWERYQNLRQATPLFQESLTLFRELQDTNGVAHVLQLMANVERSRQHYEQAGTLYREALLLLRGIGFQAVAVCVEIVAGIGGLVAAQGKLERGTRLLGAVDTRLLKGASSAAKMYASDTAFARTQLDAEAFDTVWAEGKKMTWDQVIAYALQEEAVPTRALHPRQDNDQTLIEPLSPRELDVLRLMIEGMTNPQIAAQLVVATGTIKAHTNSIFGKLGVSNRVQAVNRAKELRLLEE